MITIGKGHSFWRRWARAWLTALDTGLSRVAGLITVFTGVGLKLIGLAPWWITPLALLGLVLLLAAWTKPATLAPPNVSSKIDLETVNEYLAHLPKVGLLGLNDAGKTTFLDAVVARPPVVQKTSQAYGQIVLVPDTRPEQMLLLLDTVGSVNRIQFAVLEQVQSAFLFIDHNDSANSHELDEERMKKHLDFAAQLASSADEDGLLLDEMIVILGKNDLWSNSEEIELKMAELGSKIEGIFNSSKSFKTCKVIGTFSNNSRSDVAGLLRLGLGYA